MSLAVYKGGLIVKDGKLCTTCCGTPVVGKCCQYNYNSSGAQPASTAEEAIQLASQSASANSAAIPNSIWTVGTPAGVPWVEGEAWYDAARNQYECEGYWTTGGYICSEETNSWCSSKPFTYFSPGETCTGEPQCPQYPPDSNPTGACCYFYSASSDESSTQEWRCADGITEQDCLMNGLNQTFYPGKTCDEIECPPVDPPVPGVCLYREDGEGTCTQYALNGDYFDGFSSEAEAQAAGDEACQYPDAPECYDCRADVAFEGDDNWSYTLTFREFTYDDAGNITGCEKLVTPNVTKASCTGDPLADAQWENDLPPTHCRPVSSEDECTEDTGVFCPNVTDCNQIDFNQGCPEDPKRSNPLP